MSAPVIVIQPDLWGRRVNVRIEPPRVEHPMRTFSDHKQACEYAAELSRQRGWLIVDETPVEQGT